MRLYWLILAILGVWRVTHLLHAEDGPWRVLESLRRSLGQGPFRQALECFYCLSLWIALPFAGGLGQNWGEKLLLWPALSGGAILLQRATTRPEGDPPGIYPHDPVIYSEDEE